MPRMLDPVTSKFMSLEAQAKHIRAKVQFPVKARFLFQSKRYKVMRGGRGSAKSWSAARALVIQAASKPLRVLCAREFQLSITESVHRLLSDQIKSLSLDRTFDIQNTIIRAKNGSEFIFAGIRTNPNKIKSTEGVDICWVEEAEKVSKRSLEILIPTIRKEGSEIWFTYNPDEEKDPVHQFAGLLPPEVGTVVDMNWMDNPWLPATLVKEKDYLYKVDPEAAAHVWGGQCRKVSAAQIFKDKYVVESFEPETAWFGPYYGCDWGFSQDPDTLVRCWLNQDQSKLYIEHEAYGVGVELDEIPKLWDSVPDARKYVIRADNSEPATISHIQNRGFNVIGASKWPGSVEDGIRWLRQFESIVIHSRCKHTEEEARLYRYKIDKLTEDVLPIIIDQHNHIWDAVRYAFGPMIAEHLNEHDVISEYESPISISPELDEFESGTFGVTW